MTADRKIINDLDLQDTYKAKNAIDPTDDQDYVTKAYGDANYGGGGPPSGSAGGVLDGTYPNPGLAAGVAGAGLAETSDVLSVNVDGTTIEINTDTLRVKSGVFDAAGAAAAAQAASQPLDSDLTALADLNAATGKTSPVDADLLPVADSAASFAIKKLTLTNLKAFLKAYFDTLYSGSATSRKTYLNKPAGNIHRAATTVGPFLDVSNNAAPWQITGVVVASGQNVEVELSAAIQNSSGNDFLVALFRDSTQIDAKIFTNTGSSRTFPWSQKWIDENPGAGTYTYEVRAAAFTSGTITVYQTNITTDANGGTSIFIAEVYTP